jgi:hypothetical protein
MSSNLKQSTDNKKVIELSPELSSELSSELSQLYPIHWMVWHNDCHQLEQFIKSHTNVLIDYSIIIYLLII